MAALCNGAGRLFWGNMLDAVGFKPLFASLVVLQVGFEAARSLVVSIVAGNEIILLVLCTDYRYHTAFRLVRCTGVILRFHYDIVLGYSMLFRYHL